MKIDGKEYCECGYFKHDCECCKMTCPVCGLPKYTISEEGEQ